MKSVTLDRKGVKVFYLPFLMIFLFSFIFTISGIPTLVNAQQQSPPIVNILSPNSERICNGKICFLNIHEPTRVWNPSTSSWVDGKANDFIKSSVDTTNFRITFTYFNQSFIIYPKYFVYNNINMNAQTFLSTLKGRFQNSNITIGISNNNIGKKMVYSINSNSQTLSLLSEVGFGIVNNSKDLLFLTDDLSTNGFNFKYNGTDLIIYPPFPSFSFDPMLTIQGVNTAVYGWKSIYTESATPTSNISCTGTSCTTTKFNSSDNTSISTIDSTAVDIIGTSSLDEGVFTNTSLYIGVLDTINWAKVLHRFNTTTDLPKFAIWNWTSGAFVVVNGSGVAGDGQTNRTFNITGVNTSTLISLAPNRRIVAVSFGQGSTAGRIKTDYVETIVSYNDLTPPTWSNNQTNNTNANRSTLFSLKWNDNNGGGLAGYIFSFDNCTGSFVNSTWTAMTGTENWSNVTKTINSTNGCPIRWRVYANDTANNWNVSDIFTFTTTQFITVCKSGSCDSTTVQGGINLAPAGWTVLITDSSWYNENVTLNKSITLTSNSATRPTINSTGTSLLINANSATVSNLTIAYNGTNSYVDNVVWITGNYTTVANNTIKMTYENGIDSVYFQNSANNTIYGNNITAQSYSSHAVYIDGSSSTNNTIDRNLITYEASSSYGIYIGANNNTIRNNNITSAGGYPPIYPYAYYDTVIIENNFVNNKSIIYNKTLQNLTITATTYGELILANSFNVTINSSSFTEAGILFLKTTNSTISNSNITTKTHAIVLRDSSKYNTIFNNNISTSGADRSYGIDLRSGNDYTNITKNNVTITGSDYNYGMEIFSNYNTISSNLVRTTNYASLGILLSGGWYNTITNTNITTAGTKARGIWLEYSSYNNITSCNITTTGAGTGQTDNDDETNSIPAALHITIGDQNRISNSILNATNYYDIFASGYSNEVNYIINSTYNKTDIMFNQSSNIKIYNQYYLDAYVNDTLGNPINSANVLIMSKNYPVNTNLVGYWKFDEGSGTTANDSSGNGNTGTLVSSPVWTNGIYGKALNFAGNSYVDAGNSSSTNPSTITIAAWVKLNDTSPTSYSRIIERGGWASDHKTESYYMYQAQSTTNIGCEFTNASSKQIDLQVSSLNLNQWYHVACTYDGSSGKLYLNGVLRYSWDLGIIGNLQTTIHPVRIGADSNGGEKFNGTIDEVQVWNRSLASDEIKELYATISGNGVQTNSSGYIPQQILNEFLANYTYNAIAGTGYLYFSNYTVNASKTYFSNSSQKVNLTSSQSLTFTLDLLNPVCIKETGNCFPTIQQAINAATNGQTVVIVRPKWFNENVVLNRSITLTSNSSTQPTINSTATSLLINANSATVSNLTIAYNGTSTNQNTVWITGNYTTLANNTISMTSMNDNHPVYVQSANNTIFGNNITCLSWDNYGIYITGSASTNNTVDSNSISYDATWSGGIEIEANNNTIRNNNITSTGGLLPIYMTPYLNTVVINNNNYNGMPIIYNNTIQNVTITATTYGELILGNSFNVTITNSSFTQGGILFLRTTNSTISNSNIATQTQALVLDDASQYNTIFNNNISTSGGDRSYGISLGWGTYDSRYNNITKNNITILNSCCYNFGINVLTSYNVFDSNSITTNAAIGIGIRLYGGNSYYNSITNTNITTSGDRARGILLSYSGYNNITSCNITTTGSSSTILDTGSDGNYIPAALHIRVGWENTISNSILNAVNYYDIFATDTYSGEYTYLINSTFNKTDIKFNESGTAIIYNQYYLDVYVNDTFGNPINSANVLATSNRSSTNTGLVGNWRFENESLGVAMDYSGNGNNGTLANMNNTGNSASGPTTNGMFGKAMNFDGNDDYVNVSNPSSLNIQNSISIFAWTKRNGNTATTYERVAGKYYYNGSLDTGSWLLYKSGSSNRFSCLFNISGNFVQISSPVDTFLTDTWYWVGCTYDGTYVRNYINGVEQGSTAATGSIAVSNYPVIIGASSNGISVQNNFNGTIDEVSIWNRGLTADEIKELYAFRNGYGVQTNSSGYIPQQTLSQFLANWTYNASSGYLYFNNYTVNASKTGFTNSSQQLNLTSNTLLTFTLTETTPPIWSSNSTSIASTYSPTAISKFNITWTDNYAVSKAFLESNFSGTPANYSMANISGSVYNFNTTLPAGTFYWKSYANDTSNNWNTSDTWYFSINKTQPVLILSNNTAAVNSSGLVGYWRFENESLGFATDYSGWNNTGTLTNMNNAGNSTSGPTTGRFGKAMQFDGVNDYIDFSLTNFNNPTKEITVSAWVNINQMKNYNGIIERNNWGVPGAISWGFVANSSGFIFSVSNGVTRYNAFGLGSANTWYYLTGTYDGSTVKIYINGVLQPNTQSVSKLTFDSITYLRVSAAGDVMYGTIDEVQIWNRSLTTNEIAELYQSSVVYGTQTNFTFSENNTGDADVNYDFFRNGTVAGVWHFDEGSGNTTIDSSDNGNTGTLTNNPTWITNSSCKYGSCLFFNGTGDYVKVNDSNSLHITDAITITAWVYIPQTAGNVNTQVFYKDSYYMNIGWNEYSKPYFYIDGSWRTTDNQYHIWPGGWEFVAATYDSSTREIKFYRDDELLETKTLSGLSTYKISVTTDNPIIPGGTTQGRQHIIDEVRIYPRALSAAEILCQYGNNCTQTIFSNETATLPAGYYYYVARASGGQNYTTSALLLPLNIIESTQVGGALSWIWKSPVIGDIIRSGSPLDWVWQVFTSGSGRKIPKGSATNWTWGNE